MNMKMLGTKVVLMTYHQGELRVVKVSAGLLEAEKTVQEAVAPGTDYTKFLALVPGIEISENVVYALHLGLVRGLEGKSLDAPEFSDEKSAVAAVLAALKKMLNGPEGGEVARLLPEQFSISDLQRLYAAVDEKWGRCNASNFRAKVMAHGFLRKLTTGRRGQLFRFGGVLPG